MSSIIINGIEIKGQVINSAKASKLLEKNQGNRTCSSKDVNRYSEMMTSDEWNEEVPQFFCRDINKNLMDGQTRLKAIVSSGVPMNNCYIIDGLDRLAMESLDVIRARTLYHRFQTSDRFDNKNLPLVKYFNQFMGIDCNKISTDRALRHFNNAHPYLKMALEMRKGKLLKFQTSSMIWATFARAIAITGKKEKIYRFVDVFKTGTSVDRNDGAALLLREHVLDLFIKAQRNGHSAFGGGKGQETLKRRVIDALYAYLNGLNVKTLPIAPDDYMKFEWES